MNVLRANDFKEHLFQKFVPLRTKNCIMKHTISVRIFDPIRLFDT